MMEVEMGWWGLPTCDDTLGVARSICVDVIDGLVYRVHQLERESHISVLVLV